MTIDRISNMLSSIKNASMAGKPFTEVSHSKECEAILKILKARGFIADIKVFKESGQSFKMMHIEIAYDNGIPKVSNIRRISKPGHRIYKKHEKIRRVVGGYGLAVVSTSRGIMSEHDAKKKKLGGELVCEVY